MRSSITDVHDPTVESQGEGFSRASVSSFESRSNCFAFCDRLCAVLFWKSRLTEWILVDLLALGAWMRSGCLNMILRVGMVTGAVVVMTIGVVLFLFSASAFGPSGDLRTVISIIAAPVGIYLFYRIGRDVWRDLKGSGDR